MSWLKSIFDDTGYNRGAGKTPKPLPALAPDPVPGAPRPALSTRPGSTIGANAAIVDPGLPPGDPGNGAAQGAIGAAAAKEARRLSRVGLASTYIRGAKGVPKQPVQVASLMPQIRQMVGDAYSTINGVP